MWPGGGLGQCRMISASGFIVTPSIKLRENQIMTRSMVLQEPRDRRGEVPFKMSILCGVLHDRMIQVAM